VKVRFLETMPSSAPGFPFMPGQVIVVSKLTPEMQRWLSKGQIELMPEEPEAAVEGHVERAVLPKARKPGVSAH
jgi:hypothetical protein